MCNNTDALKKLIDESLVLDGDTGLTLTGWNETDDTYGRGSMANRITTSHGIVRGKVAIQPGGGNAGRDFGFDRYGKEESTPLTIDRVRGVLVTALAVSQTEPGRKLAGSFAGIIEVLTANCFHPTSFDIGIEAVEDPSINIVMTNGMVTVRLEGRAIDELEQEIKLELPVKYILGSGFCKVLTDPNGNSRGYSSTGLTVLEDGKWNQLTGINSRPYDNGETIVVDRIEPESVVQHIEEARRPLVLAALKEVIRHLEKLGGSVNIYSVHLSHGDYRRQPALHVSMANASKRIHYSLDFKA